MTCPWQLHSCLVAIASRVETAVVGICGLAFMVGLHGACTAWIAVAYSCDRIDLTIDGMYSFSNVASCFSYARQHQSVLW